MSSVLVGMFDTQAAATQARARLMSAGFSADAVSLAGGSASSAAAPTGTMASDEPHHEGAISRFFSELFGSDDKRADTYGAGYADTYKEAFKRGSYGVTVTTTSDDELDRAQDILNDCGAVDIDERAASWRSEGWTGGAATAMGSTTAGTTLEAGATRKLQEIEEELKVGKRAVARGGVRVFSRMTEVPVSETVRLREERADVTRTAVDRPATEADFSAFKEGSIEVRETAEEAVVSKTARVTGEVEIGKTVTEREETIRETVRKTEVDVERMDGGKMTGDRRTGYTDATGSSNRDPLTGEPGAHPVGTAVGATAGAVAAGAAVGSVAGPVGTAVGAAVGAVAGGLAGKGVAETVDPTTGKTKSRS